MISSSIFTCETVLKFLLVKVGEIMTLVTFESFRLILEYSGRWLDGWDDVQSEGFSTDAESLSSLVFNGIICGQREVGSPVDPV